jgi:uncharacterized ferredoxin-like protein
MKDGVMNQHEIFMNALRHVAELCAVAAITAPKSGGQLFSKGARPFIETVIVENRETLNRLAAWLRERGTRLKAPIWFRDAETAEKLDLVLFIGLAKWYPPVYDCGACGYATCAEFLRAREHQKPEGIEDWEFPGPICQIRCIDLGVALSMSAIGIRYVARDVQRSFLPWSFSDFFFPADRCPRPVLGNA